VIKRYLVTISKRSLAHGTSSSVSYFSTAINPVVANAAALVMAKSVYPDNKIDGSVFVCVEEQQPRTWLGRLFGL
jgi:hypothetical protein